MIRRTLSLACLVAASLMTAVPAAASPSHCPPGLAKKTPPCIPPGQVGRTDWRVGDILDGSYWRITRHGLPGLPRGEGYYRLGENDVVFRVDEDTMRILQIIALTDAILN